MEFHTTLVVILNNMVTQINNKVEVVLILIILILAGSCLHVYLQF